MPNKGELTVAAENVEDLKKQLKGNKRYLKGEITKLNNIVGIEGTKDGHVIESRMDRLNTLFDKYQTLLLRLANEEVMLDDQDLEDYFHETLSLAKQQTTLNTRLVTPASGSSSQTQNLQPQNLQSQVKLPPISLPSFSGKYSEWTSFYDTFISLIHNNNEISDIQKFHYLKSTLKGDAAQLITTLEISASNYNIAWNSLKERFDNKRLMLQNHIKAILSTPSVNKESFTPLRNLLDQSTQHLQSLMSMNRPAEKRFDDLIVHIIANKLDSSTRREWESSIDFNEFPDWKKLRDFLANKCNVLEMEAVSLNRQDRERDRLPERKTFKQGISLSTTSNKRLKCNHCYKEHLIINCEGFKALPLQTRVDEARTKNLCTNCLRPGHFASSCTSRGCQKCSRRHHTLLHLEDTLQSPSEPKGSATPTTSSSLPAMSHHTCPTLPSQALLSTCVVKVRDVAGNYHEARVLLDSGSQVNFSTQKFAERVKLPVVEINMPVKGISQSISYNSA